MPVQWKADNKASTSGGLRPYVASVVENRLPSKRQPKAQTVALACCDKRFEQPLANARRDSRSCIFDFDQHIIAGRFGQDVDLSPARHRFQGVGNQVEKHALYTRAHQRRLYSYSLRAASLQSPQDRDPLTFPRLRRSWP